LVAEARFGEKCANSKIIDEKKIWVVSRGINAILKSSIVVSSQLLRVRTLISHGFGRTINRMSQQFSEIASSLEKCNLWGSRKDWNMKIGNDHSRSSYSNLCGMAWSTRVTGRFVPPTGTEITAQVLSAGSK
jgi:hypothetical protein